MTNIDHLGKRLQKDIFTRGEISKLVDFEARTDANRQMREEDTKAREQSKPRRKLIMYGAAVLVAAGIGGGSMAFAQARGGSESPPTPAEINSYVLEHGQVPPDAG